VAADEMFGIVNVSARLSTMSAIAWSANVPVATYSRMSSEPMIPKIAPRRPTVTASGPVSRRAPAEPARPETKYTRGSARCRAPAPRPSEPVEREHVERDVQHAGVEEHRGDEAVPLAVQVDRRSDQRAVLEDLPARRVQTCALVDRDEVDEDVHRDEGDRGRRLEAGHRASCLPHGSRLLRGADARLLDRGVLGALDPDRPKFMHSSQIGRPHSEHETSVSRSGCR
jgi:hypothetical protein